MILNVHRVAALTLAAGGASEAEVGDWLPPHVWEQLDRDGFIRTVFDGTNEGRTEATPAGMNFLKRVLAP